MKKTTADIERRNLLALRAQRRALERLGEQHLLREDQVVAVVVRQLVLVAHRDGVERARDGAERAPDALLEAGVLELVELVAAAEARVDRHLLLGVLHGRRALDHPGEGRLQPPEGLPEGPVRRPQAGPRRVDDLEDVLADVDVRNSHSVTATMIAVTSALAVASGSSTFQPNDIS